MDNQKKEQPPNKGDKKFPWEFALMIGTLVLSGILIGLKMTGII